MANMPKRKPIRIVGFDYASSGAYFITICTVNREKLFWSGSRGDLRSPADGFVLSHSGMIVEQEIRKLDTVYPGVRVEKHCIMPDHIHLILVIGGEPDGRTQFAPTVSRVIKQFKGSITKQIGRPIWQKSFYDYGIRNQQDYDEIWEYIDNNPLKYRLKNAP